MLKKHHISGLYKKILIPIGVIAFFVVGLVIVYAINIWYEGYRVDNGIAAKVIGGNSGAICKVVTNNCNKGVGIFVPTKYDTEWQGTNGFINKKPACVTIAPCTCRTNAECGNSEVCSGYVAPVLSTDGICQMDSYFVQYSNYWRDVDEFDKYSDTNQCLTAMVINTDTADHYFSCSSKTSSETCIANSIIAESRDFQYFASPGNPCNNLNNPTALNTYTGIIGCDWTPSGSYTEEVMGQCMPISCGVSNYQYFTEAPAINLCNAGTPSTVGGFGPWTWTCAGPNGGTIVSCMAFKRTVSTPSCLLPSTCFVKGTNVLMLDGSSKKIEDVNIGDKVLGMSGSSNTVLDFDRPSLGDRLLYSINDGVYFVTSEHPFMTLNGWKSIDPDATKREMPNVSVGILSVGDILIKDQSMDRVFTIMSKSSDPLQTLYNIKLDGNNTYYANNYLVHNKQSAELCHDDCLSPSKCWIGAGSCNQFLGGSGAYCNTNSDCAQNYCDPNTFRCFECLESSPGGCCVGLVNGSNPQTYEGQNCLQFVESECGRNRETHGCHWDNNCQSPD